MLHVASEAAAAQLTLSASACQARITRETSRRSQCALLGYMSSDIPAAMHLCQPRGDLRTLKHNQQWTRAQARTMHERGL